ncbi:hypothetical protein K488DRAFT_49542 [Vararia minispora EC-137]|uniref:Uncharacterized protein n=1 Tax=Vararia minispora EC-137 TaxID=1314806 RepID=A0ACB8QLR1_9AGAM|nr:hypothetical protein K488DRAFT_49542 [Vararia minispora EC-137]
MSSGVALPQPRSQLAFSLDPMRYHLLGQLEYYLSPQNLAQDLFLRTKMDAKGWIPIALLASFKRVQALTQQEALVHEVLAYSRVVEVRVGHVRPGDGEWKQYVLPNAPPSVVEPGLDGAPAVGTVLMPGTEVVPDGDDEDEDEDEVEIIMGQGAGHA